ncbi:MAG: hypothetical protein ACXVP5_10550 [Tumebacillaceae bacterium]|jgi:hypothetical protein
MADGTGKTKISELKLEVYVDDDIRAMLRDILDGKKDTLELQHVYFRHLHIDELKHEGLKIAHVRIPVGRIAKVKLKVSMP